MQLGALADDATRRHGWNQLCVGAGSDVWRPSQLTAAARAAELEVLVHGSLTFRSVAVCGLVPHLH